MSKVNLNIPEIPVLDVDGIMKELESNLGIVTGYPIDVWKESSFTLNQQRMYQMAGPIQSICNFANGYAVAMYDEKTLVTTGG